MCVRMLLVTASKHHHHHHHLERVYNGISRASYYTHSRPVSMDIDDILREVDPTIHTVPQESRDLQDLTRAWVAERSAPELLKYAPAPAPAPAPASAPSPSHIMTWLAYLMASWYRHSMAGWLAYPSIAS